MAPTPPCPKCGSDETESDPLASPDVASFHCLDCGHAFSDTDASSDPMIQGP